MVRYLPVLIETGLLVYCLIDCVQADADRVRGLAKGWWIVLIILLPLVGGIAWLVAGRPEQPRRRDVPWPSTRTAGFPEYERPRRLAPDDDPEFLAGMRASDDKHEQMLRDWEAQLRERERRLQAGEDAPES
ncbi:PLD nuclease N-terminal domain-containing protein [Cellulomonas alba]|uniref:PLD nuclease N-terminal domain-containing protein n=1 Tax=Cellulomonas alba TaxID=3053467 RepID=A0ABT7SFA2_9CELL|nr:PLD nuclease N-terminal domain-containing protein [Cellulomonas alba]MDM7854870.1 PLD nuclease N-terminal domain-containing protein [Cellulomonas alba]